jgi:DNA-directed RNA polymerase subunit RPC12/RpoP
MFPSEDDDYIGNHEILKQEETEAKRLENIECPLCKSKNKKHINIRKNNGIIGPGYHSSSIIDFYLCLDCGIHYSDINKKK